MWPLLYLMIAVAAWLVWRQDGFAGGKLPLTLFAGQLVLNGLWSVLFFRLQDPWAAAVEISLLWAAILATLIAFGKRSVWSGGGAAGSTLGVGEPRGDAQHGDLAAERVREGVRPCTT